MKPLAYAVIGGGLWLTAALPVGANDPKNGRFLFHTYCAACHITAADPVLQAKARTGEGVATAIATIDRMGELRRLSSRDLSDIAAFIRGDAGAATFVDMSGLWVAEGAPGWGLSITHQESNRRLFALLHTYSDDGRQRWLASPAGEWTQDETVWSGIAYETRGGQSIVIFDPTKVQTTSVGQLTLVFAGVDKVQLVWAVPGTRTVTKDLVRLRF
jgi:hypothetical protein